jgi:hypothetical protein
MPRLSINQTNFTAGEISPRLAGRTDISQYGNAAKAMFNCHPVIHGGAMRRAGTRFSQTAKLSGASASVLIDFVVSRDLAYQLEFGHLYVRVFSPNGVYTGIELASPYTAAQLVDIDYTQGADTMFLFHGDVAPQRLRSFSPTTWDLSAAPFTALPFGEVGYRPAATLTLGATSGASVAFTTSASVLLASDVGRDIVSQAGVGTIIAVSGPTAGTIKITTTFASTSYPSGSWEMDVSPQAFLIPSAASPVGAVVSLNGALTRAATLTLTATTGAITINASAGVFVAGDAGKVLYADGGIVTLAYVSATQCTGTTTKDFATTSYASGAWGITGDTFRTGVDEGKYVRINDGLMQITACTPTKATATVIVAASSVIAAPPLAWTLEAAMWSAAFGYPSTGTLYQQRLWVGKTKKYPQTIFGSRTGLYLDFTKGDKDTDACIFEIASDTVNPISFLSSSRELVILTYGGEFTMSGGNDTAITPTNVRIKPQSTYGSKGVRPLTVGKETLFVQRSGRKLRAMSYQLAVDANVAPDLTALAEHITAAGGIVDMAYQQEPDGIVWLVLGDGTLASCTLDREQSVTGWARHYTQGAFESVSVIPNGGADQVWFIVRRRVGGTTTVRYVEWMDPDFEPMLPGAALGPGDFPPYAEATVYGCTVDAGKVFDNPGSATLTGLGHHEGATVDCVADGCNMGTFVVTGGQITLPRIPSRALVGLHFRSTVTMLTPEAGTGAGSAQGNSMSAREITMRFLNTVGARVYDGEGREQRVPWRHFGQGVLNQPPPVFTGLVHIEAMGWDRGKCEMSVVQDEPLPMHLLSVVRKISIND